MKYSAIKKARDEYEKEHYPPEFASYERRCVTMNELIAILQKCTEIEFDRRKGEERRVEERRKEA